MKLVRIRNIACFLVATMDGGKLNFGRQYDRVYYKVSTGAWKYGTGRYTTRTETDKITIEKLEQYLREKQQAETSGKKD